MSFVAVNVDLLTFSEAGFDGKRRDTGQISVIAKAVDKSITCSFGQACCGKHLIFVQGAGCETEVENR